MKPLRIFSLLLSLAVALSVEIQNCKKADPVTPAPYAFLSGSWRDA